VEEQQEQQEQQEQLLQLHSCRSMCGWSAGGETKMGVRRESEACFVLAGGFAQRGTLSCVGQELWERRRRRPARRRAVVRALRDGAEDLHRTLDVVLCHISADYDTLAAAVGLARLRGGHTIVVLSGGSNPTVERFLRYFQPMFPIRSPKGVNPEHVRWIGVVDCSRKDRLGICAEWVEHADAVEVYDHHVEQDACDLINMHGGVRVVEDDVGAATTIIVEKLRDAQLKVSPSEATLMALGIHSDTGSFLFDSTRPRDAMAMAWLLEQGANMKTVINFKSAQLSGEHRHCLNEGLKHVVKEELNGLVFAHCFLTTESFVKGLSAVAENILEVLTADALLFTVVNQIKKKREAEPVKQQISVIARSRPRVENVDLGEVLSRWGGGGHPKAAAVTIRTDRDPAELNEEILDAIREEILSSPSTLKF